MQEKLKEHILHMFGFSIDNDWIQKLPAVMWCMVKETKNKKQKNKKTDQKKRRVLEIFCGEYFQDRR